MVSGTWTAAAVLTVALAAQDGVAGAAGNRAQRRPGYVTGVARTECGRPLPSFTVNAYGFDGQLNDFPSGLPPLGGTKGHNGSYALRTVDHVHHKAVNALVRSVEAYAPVRYQGHTYSLPLDPADGKPNGIGPGDFSGHSGRGIVRNFVLRTSGLKPGSRKYRGSQTVGVGDPAVGAFYGANVLMFLSLGNVPGQTLTVTFTPMTRSLVDGCPATTVRRSVALGQFGGNENYVFQDIPLGFYRVSATLSGASPVTLQLGAAGTPASSVAFEPLPTSEWPDGSGSVDIMAS